MDVDFEANQLKPGDSGFVYDVKKDFSSVAKVDDGWDEDSY